MCIHTGNGGETEGLFDHTDLSGAVVGEGDGRLRLVEAVVHMVSPYVLPYPGRLIVELRDPFLQLLLLRLNRRRRRRRQHRTRRRHSAVLVAAVHFSETERTNSPTTRSAQYRRAAISAQ